MINNEYKKYFDQVSPDRSLIEDTKQKMLDECNKSFVCSLKNNRISFVKYGVLTACAAAAAVSLVISPKFNRTDISTSENPSGNNQAEVTFTDEKKQVVEATVPEKAVTGTMTKPAFSERYSAAYTEVATEIQNNTVSISAAATPLKNVTEVCISTIPEYRVTEPPHENNVSESVQQTFTAPDTTIPQVTSEPEQPGFRPGSMSEAVINSEMPSPMYSDNKIYRVENADVSGVRTDIYVNIEYNYSAPFLKNTINISPEDAAGYFGENYCPEKLSRTYPGYKMKIHEEYGPENGMCMIFGEYTGLESKKAKFAVATIYEEYTDLRYDVFSNDSLPTAIGGTEYIFTALSQYDDVYFCSFKKDRFSYTLCFKEFDLDEIIETLLSF